ncbi:hypothetical protein [Cupriavidus sp. UYPR2.512]|uniref:hypothetical protein n=1 Tax=Cupriavidus sp. UYPR2.512 TaxID=1080187 RepID=UPI000371200C|nr:hypothetical protein [Cupriavidus sp. UYPR2.512]UIF89244.1 hypothetical protein KAF44_30160 [Cupriavidus necator]
MSASLKWRFRPPLFVRVKRHNLKLVQGIPRGLGRDYVDAQRLGLIDSHIAALVAAMNVSDLMHTVACCEGHGGWGSFSSPYVAFEAPVELAAMLHERLQADVMKSRSRLNFYWSVEGGFGSHRQIVFRLSIPGIDRYRWVNRNRLDRDICVVHEMLLNAIAQFRGAADPGK